ncbi:MAG: HAD family hydrolase [Proteobacteria bacterium]|nr:HAD family hydrolase [Pseudomonadota bacterium]
MTPNLVIFDCDGVLIDSEHLGCIAETRVFRRHGLDMADDFIVNHCIGLSFKSSMKLVEDHFNWTVTEACIADIVAETKHVFETELTAISGIADLLDALTLPRCVASSSAPERLQHSLGLVGLYDRLAPHIFSATMVENGKPAPDLFLYAARRMGHAPGSCVVIEDSIAGVTAAKAAGMHVIGFTGGSHVLPGLGARLRQTGADAVVGDMQEVARILGA